jgi:hypothetical protein
VLHLVRTSARMSRMDVTLQYFDGCPNWKETDAHLETLRGEGVDLVVSYQLIETQEAAEVAGFRGSPTVVVGGIDPFADPDAPVGLACRVYPTGDGYAGSPTLDQLRSAIAGAEGG